MPELAHKKTADMDGLRYSPDDPYYRLGPFRSCLYVAAFRLLNCTSSFQRVRAETVELTERCYSGGDSQGLPGFSSPRILGIPTISFAITTLISTLKEIKRTKNKTLVHGQHNIYGANRKMMIQLCKFATRPVPGPCHTCVIPHIRMSDATRTNESCVMDEQSMSRICRIMSHTRMSYGIRMNDPFHT